MTATPAADAPALTPARKRLIRQAFNEWGSGIVITLENMPSFRGVSAQRIIAWGGEMGLHVHEDDRGCPTCRADFEQVTQATPAPATPDPGVTGGWYSARAIARGLDVGVERVYGWKQFGWLGGGPLYTAADIRAFVRGHPSEIKHRYLSDESWLWLVSVLAGSREGAA